MSSLGNNYSDKLMTTREIRNKHTVIISYGVMLYTADYCNPLVSLKNI